MDENDTYPIKSFDMMDDWFFPVNWLAQSQFRSSFTHCTLLRRRAMKQQSFEHENIGVVHDQRTEAGHDGVSVRAANEHNKSSSSGIVDVAVALILM